MPRKRNSSKVNLIISVTFHTVLVVGIFLLAAHEGMLGKKLQALTVIVPPKEVKKEPEQVKPKVVEQKPVEQKQAETPKVASAPPPPVQSAAPPPPVDSAPAAAPAAVVLPSMDFNDGAVEVATSSDPKQLYKMLIEGALRARWARPEDMQDDSFVADVEVNIDPKGNITGSRLAKGCGDTRWDNSVKAAVAAVKTLSHAPPKGFPASFTVRFDVQKEQGDSIQVSSR